MAFTQPISGFNARLASISTVTVSATSFDLVSLPTVKAVLGITALSENDYLATQIGFASAAIANYCNRIFVKETLRDEFWPAKDAFPFVVPGGLSALQLSRYPIISVSVNGVTENGDALVDGTDYRVDYGRGQLIRLDGNAYPANWPTYALSVIYSAGYETIPSDIQDACCRMIKARRDARNRDPFLKQQNIPGVMERQWWVAGPGQTGNMPPDVVDILDNYRTPVIG